MKLLKIVISYILAWVGKFGMAYILDLSLADFGIWLSGFYGVWRRVVKKNIRTVLEETVNWIEHKNTEGEDSRSNFFHFYKTTHST